MILRSTSLLPKVTTNEDCMTVFLIKTTFLVGVSLTYIILFVNTALL